MKRIYTMCKRKMKHMDNNKLTDCQIEIKKIRESTGMNRKEFCEYFDIPYRTVTEWERGTRNAPDYVLRLMAYYVRMEKMNLYH